MKEIVEDIVIRQRKYVAEDGRTFEVKSDCVSYEKNVLRDKKIEKVRNSIERNENAEGHAPVDGYEYPEDHDFTWYRPKTGEEVIALCGAYGIDADSTLISGLVGEWLCIEEGYDGDVWMYSLKDSIKNVEEFIGYFDYDVKITKKEI